jgi:hypothetical protein
MNFEVNQLDIELEKINKTISFINKTPYKIDSNNFYKINETDINKLDTFINEMKELKNSIISPTNIDALLIVVNNKLQKYKSNIINISNKYDNLISNYLLILLITIKISLSIAKITSNDTIQDYIKKHSYTTNLNEEQILNNNYTIQNDKILFANKIYLELILFNTDKKILYNYTNKNNSVIKIIEFHFTKNNEKIIIDDKTYNLK